MCDVIGKILNLMLPYIDDLLKCTDIMIEKERKLHDISELHNLITDDSFKCFQYNNNQVLKEILEGFDSNLSNYEAYKYILSSNSDDVRALPQYSDARNYLDRLCDYINTYYNDYLLEYDELCQKQKVNNLVKKYYDMFSSNNIIIDDVDELNMVLEKFSLDIDEKLELITYILKNISKNHHDEKEKIIEYDLKDFETKITNNSKLLNSNYNELLDVVSSYVDLSKPISETVESNFINKINVNNILLAKKVWLLKNSKGCFDRKNYKKVEQYLNEFDYVDELLNKVKNIEDKKEAIRIIKGELNEE